MIDEPEVTNDPQNKFVSAMKSIGGAVLVLLVFTVVYGVLLAVLDLVPLTFFERFSPFIPEVLPVVIAAWGGIYLGALGLKKAMPNVQRIGVSWIITAFIGFTMVGGLIAMLVRGDCDGWEGILSSALLLIGVWALIKSDDRWADL
jgi:drug/metabolite transporter superfamily protein YnfA